MPTRSWCGTNIPVRGKLAFLEVDQYFFGAIDHWFGDTGQTSDLNSVTLVGPAFDNLMEEYDLIIPFPHGDIEVLQTGQAPGELGELMIMSGKERFGADLVVQMFHDRPSQA